MESMDRTKGIKILIGLLAVFSIVAIVTSFPRSEEKSSTSRVPTFGSSTSPSSGLKEAMYYRKIDEPPSAVWCQLCPRKCVIPEGKLGFCRARKNIKGTLYSLGYSRPCAVHIDPIEKKPFFHVLPKSVSFSIASAGCNLRCKFCQNWEISQFSPEETKNNFFTPDKIVEMALKNGCRSIAYTYSEPTNFYEYMLDIAKLAKQKGILNVYHSNGYINPVPLKELCKYLDAANIDLKGFTPGYYQELCEGELEPVLETLKTLKKEGVWVEITNLVVPGRNDDPGDIKRMCQWIMANLGADTPLHFSRFYPTYHLANLPQTPLETLEKSRKIARDAGLRYVYIGNVWGNEGENTYCPKCKKILLKRTGYTIIENNIAGGKCKFCRMKIAGRWQ